MRRLSKYNKDFIIIQNSNNLRQLNADANNLLKELNINNNVKTADVN